MSPQRTHPPRHCPVPNCTWTVPTITTRPHASLKEHLMTSHKETKPSDYMTEAYCTKHGYHLCSRCDTTDTIYTSAGHLQNHITTKHSRKNTNITLVLNVFRHASPETQNNWKRSLDFLHNHQPTPPPFRRSIWHHLKAPTRKEYFHTYHTIANWAIEATPQLHPSFLKDYNPPQWDTEASPFWKLLILAEPLLLAPIKNTVHRSYSDALKSRLALFKTGRIQELFSATWHPQPLPAKHHTQARKKDKQARKRQQWAAQTTDEPPAAAIRAAQQAADLGNYSLAYQRLTAHMPTATLTPERIERVKQTLFPPRRDPPTNTRHRKGTKPTAAPTLQLQDDTFEAALHQMTRGTASGPFATCTDAVTAMALHRTTASADATRPYFHTIKTITEHIITGQVPQAAQQTLSSNFFLALHKDPNNLEKLRPIGIGTTLRRVAAKAALVHTSDTITPLLLRGGQYGIQVAGGVDFVAQTTAADVAEYIDRQTTNDANKHNPAPPSRALIMLDLHNMFNNTSRTAARQILADNKATAPLLPLYDLLTKTSTHSWYFDETDTPRKIDQEEGFPQGCPLSPLFACLVLLHLTTKLNREQNQRANKRKQQDHKHDDNQGGLAHTASIMDDTSVCLPHEDLPWFIEHFAALGKPLGINLNYGKTKILTSTNSRTPMDDLHPTARDSLSAALTTLSPSNPADAEITTGARFLGQPVGSHTFAQTFIRDRTEKIRKDTSILHKLHNLQTRSILFKYSAVPATLHLLPADITQAHRKPDQRTSLWSSPTTDAVDRLIVDFVAQLTATPPNAIPAMSTLLAAIPQRLGGLGYHHAAASAYPRLLTQTARAISLATSKQTPIPAPHRRWFNNWQHSEDPRLTQFRRGLALLTKELADEAIVPTVLTGQPTIDKQTIF